MNLCGPSLPHCNDDDSAGAASPSELGSGTERNSTGPIADAVCFVDAALVSSVFTPTARAGNRPFGLLSALRARTNAPCKPYSLWETLRTLNRPRRARTVAQCLVRHEDALRWPRQLDGQIAQARPRYGGSCVGRVAILVNDGELPRRVDVDQAAARKVLGWPKICKLAHAFLWEHSYKGLELAQLLGQLGVLRT
jgi:hypothetical protein